MAFSTCSSHLVVGILFFGSAAITYWRLKSNHSGGTLFYTFVTSMFNPMIYSLRNKGVIAALRKLLLKHSKMDLLVFVFWETCWLPTFSPWKAIHYQLMMYFVTLKFRPEI
jgi:hypothetical protein